MHEICNAFTKRNFFQLPTDSFGCAAVFTWSTPFTTQTLIDENSGALNPFMRCSAFLTRVIVIELPSKIRTWLLRSGILSHTVDAAVSVWVYFLRSSQNRHWLFHTPHTRLSHIMNRIALYIVLFLLTHRTQEASPHSQKHISCGAKKTKFGARSTRVWPTLDSKFEKFKSKCTMNFHFQRWRMTNMFINLFSSL